MKRTVEPVPTVCKLFADQFEQIIILGTTKKDKWLNDNYNERSSRGAGISSLQIWNHAWT